MTGKSAAPFAKRRTLVTPDPNNPIGANFGARRNDPFRVTHPRPIGWPSSKRSYSDNSSESATPTARRRLPQSAADKGSAPLWLFSVKRKVPGHRLRPRPGNSDQRFTFGVIFSTRTEVKFLLQVLEPGYHDIFGRLEGAQVVGLHLDVLVKKIFRSF